MKQILSDLQQKNGCRVSGWFEIDRVPGNFHFSSHGYGNLIPQLINKGVRKNFIIKVNLTCHIKSKS